MNGIIPVVHCFDDNYSLPAGVAFFSMLKQANPEYFYKLYVLHNSVSDENKSKLLETVSLFKNASLEFIDMENKFSDMFEKTNVKGHYSKEMYYKFAIPSLFAEFKKVIVSDVDVIYQGDISKNFLEFNTDDDCYIAGVKGIQVKSSFLEDCIKEYKKDFSKNEINRLLIGAGFLIYNLEKMRKDNIEEKLINYANKNIHRIRQPEQDCLNLVCYPKIKLLDLSNMVCNYLYDLLKTEDDFKNIVNYSISETKNALLNPIQLHFAGYQKPWNSFCTKYEAWYEYISQTPFLKGFILDVQNKTAQTATILTTEKIKSSQKVLVSFKIPFHKNRKIKLIKEKDIV